MLSAKVLNIVLLILQSVLFDICTCDEYDEDIPEFFLYETVYPTARTISLSRITSATVAPDTNLPPNRELFTIPQTLGHLSTISIAGTLRKSYETPATKHKPVNQTYVYRLPSVVYIGDNITISGSLQDNARKLRFELIHRQLSKYYNVDYQNIAIKVSIDIRDVAVDKFSIAVISEDTYINTWEIDTLGKIFDSNQFKFQMAVNPKPVAPGAYDTFIHPFVLDLRCNDVKIHSMQLEGLNRIGYLQISGHYSMVHDIKFEYYST